MHLIKSITIGAAAAVGLFSAVQSEAAVLIGKYTHIPNVSGKDNFAGFVNFADEGTLDWALWEYSGSSSRPGTPTSSKEAADYIGDVFAIGGNGNLRGANGTDLEISTTPGAVAGQGRATTGAILNASLQGEGAGVGLTITVPTTDEYIARIYVGGFSTQNSPLTATLPGAAPVEFTASYGAGDGTYKDAGILELTFQADAVDGINNVLEVTFILNPSTNNSSHVLIQGATLVPEPAALSLLSLGSLSLLRRRRA